MGLTLLRIDKGICQRIGRPSLWGLLLGNVAGLLLLAGCFGAAEAPPEPNLLDTLPADWMPVDNDGTWKEINIDSDKTQVEFLLFYTYNNQDPSTNSGPTGAVIYDLQNNSEFVPAANVLAMPYQPSGSYIPYRALPNYWEGSGDGFIAPTGKHGQVVFQVVTRGRDSQRRAVEVTETNADGLTTTTLEEAPVQELLITDGGDTVSVVWWRNLVDGYGAASVHAGAGIKKLTYETADLDTSPLIAFDGYEPFNDRSELCVVTHYDRLYLTEEMRDQDLAEIAELARSTESDESAESTETVDIIWVSSALGIDFCDVSVAQPFYPEGIVLRYLKTQDSSDLALLVDFADEESESFGDTLRQSLQSGTIRISALFAPSHITFDTRKDSRATVCAEFIGDDLDAEDRATVGGELEGGERDGHTAVQFRLRYSRPDINNPSTDEFKIEAVAPIPAPEGGPPVNCNSIVPAGTPGRAGLP